MNVLIAFIFGILAGISNRPDHHQSSEKLNDAAAVARPGPDVPPSVGNKGDSDEQKKQRRDTVKFWVEVAGFIVLFAYAAFTLIIMCASLKSADAASTQAELQRQQTELLRQQLIGTQATIVMLRFDIWYQPDSAQGFRSIIESNVGHVIATDIHASFDVFQKREPGLKDIGKPEHFELDIPQYMPGASRATPHAVSWLTPEVWDIIKISSKTKTIMVKGEFSYNNGFTKIASQPICQIWVARPPIGGMIPQSWVDCAGYEAHLKFLEDVAKKEMGNN